MVRLLADWRAAGGRTALVTASPQRLAEAVAEHLGLFDEAHGSSPERNLKGDRKAALASSRWGDAGFVYVGDAVADLPVWAAAQAVVTATPSRASRVRVDRLGRDAVHVPVPRRAAAAYLRLLRPHQWLKNLLVFLPLLAAHDFTAASLAAAALAFVAFSLVASGTYVFNDLLDLSADRAHPRKQRRPAAAGDVHIAHATLLAPALVLSGLGASLAASPQLALLVFGYLLLTSAYSLRLKRIAVVDICALALLYTLRIVAGGAATQIPLSVWLLAFSMFLFFALAALKRQAELVDGVATGRVKAHGRGYRSDDVAIVSGMVVSSGMVSVLVLALYLDSPAVREHYRTPEVLWGACVLLLFWINRMALVTHRGRMHDDPLVFAARDPVSLLCAGLVLLLAAVGTMVG